MSLRDTASVLRSAIEYAQTAIESALRDTNKEFHEELHILEGERGIKQIQNERDELENHVEIIRSNLELFRDELTKAYQILDNMAESKQSTRDFRNFVQKKEEEYSSNLKNAFETMKRIKKREDELNELLRQIQPRAEIPERINLQLIESIPTVGDRSDETQPLTEAVGNLNLNENRHQGTVTTILAKNHLLDLPRFNGNMSEWGPFWDLFKVLVHETHEPNIIKYAALRNACTGRAAEMLRRYSQDGSAYNEAIERFRSIYDSDKTQFKCLYDKLKAVKTVRENLREIRTTFNTVHALINQIARINQDIDTDAFLVEVRYKFPRSILEQVARIEKEKYNGKITRMKDLLNEIEDYIQVQEIVQGEYLADGEIGNERVFNVRSKEAIGRMNCKFCGRTNHKSQDCLKVKNQKDRKQVIIEKKLCFNCLGARHSAGECRSNGCQNCNKRHHTSICDRKQYSNPNRINFQNNFREGRMTSKNQSRGRNFNSSYRNNNQNRNRSGERNDRNPRERPRNNDSRRYESRSGSRSRDSRRTARDSDWRPRRDDTPNPNGRVVFTVQHTVRTRTSRLISTKFPVWGKYQSNYYKRVDVLFDTGAEDTFISKALAEKLNAIVINPEVRMNLSYFTGESEERLCQKVIIYLRMRKAKRRGDEEVFMAIKAYTIDFITKPVETNVLEQEDVEFMRLNRMEICEKKESISDIQLLIGNDYYHKLMDNSVGDPIELPSGLSAIKTKLENVWIPFGRKRNNDSQVMSVKSEEDFAEKFTELEMLGITEKEENNEEIVQKFKETVEINDKGEISVEFPWKDNMKKDLFNNKPLAYSRFQNFLKSPKTKQAWGEVVKQMKDQEDQQIIEEVKEVETENPTYYIPYQTVTNTSSNTTKVRIVLDASAHLKGKRSLNQSIYQGPSILPDLLSILLRTRCYPFVLTCDVAKAFWQIRLKEKERDATRFLWLRNPEKPASPDNIREMRYCRVPFGVNAAPFLLEMSISYYTEKSEVEPWLKEAIKELLYVDNLFILFNDKKELFEKYQTSKEHFKKLSMNIREYSSNATDELEKIPEVDKSKAKTQKLLGYIWNNDKDTITIKIPKLGDKKQLTRRDAIKFISAVFDPLGIIGPILNEAKSLVPELFEKTSKWDAPLTDELIEKLQKFEKKIRKYEYEFPRHIIPKDSSKVSIAIFSDASENLFATVAYIITEGPTGKSTALLASKQRLSPKRKKQTIPRLELLGIWLASKIAKILVESLKLQLEKIYFFSDSEIALAWISNEDESKVFIQNRVNFIRQTCREIQDKQIEILFAHIATDLNVADLATKGVHNLDDLKNSSWFTGPEFLRKDENEWPITKTFKIGKGKNETSTEEQNNPTQEIQIKPTKTTCLITSSKINIEYKDRIVLGVSNNWKRVIRHTGYCLKFIKKRVANRLKNNKLITALEKAIPELYQIKWDSDSKYLSIEEREAAERYIYRNHQTDYDIKEDLIKQWKRDEDGLIFLNTRLGNSIKKKYMHRIVINPISKLGTIIILDLHERNFHAGFRTLLGIIFEKYAGKRWQSAIKSTLKRCPRCARKHNHPFPMPEAPDLQDRRVQPAHHPFEHCGMDFFGPIYLRMDDDSVIKAYILIITCMTTRNIYLESMYSLSTAEFLLSIRRFVCMYGCPSSITTDNGRTFKLASKVIEEQATIDKGLEKVSGDIRIKWYFNVPSSPWQGGHFERLVAIAKKALKNAIQKRQMTKPLFDTLIREVCVVINSRPLIYIDEGDEGGFVIRPIDIIRPEFRSMNLGTESETSEVETALSQYREVKAYMERFWSVWEQYYLPQRNFTKLRPSNRAFSGQKVPEVNELVLVKNDNEPREKWKMGKITRLIRSKDGEIRAAEVKIHNADRRKHDPGSHEIMRTVNNLVPLNIKGPNGNNEKVITPTKDDLALRKGNDGQKMTRSKHNKKLYQQTVYNTRSRCRREQTRQTIVRSTDRHYERWYMPGNLKNWLYYLAILFMVGSSLGTTTTKKPEVNPSLQYMLAADRIIEVRDFSEEQENDEKRVTQTKSVTTQPSTTRMRENPTTPKLEPVTTTSVTTQKPKVVPSFENNESYAASRLIVMKDFSEETKIDPGNPTPAQPQTSSSTSKPTTTMKSTTVSAAVLINKGKHIPVEEFEDRELVRQYELQTEEESKTNQSRRRIRIQEEDSSSGEDIEDNPRQRHQKHQKNVERNNAHPDEEGTRMECTDNGVILHNSNFNASDRYTVCSESHCVGPMNASAELEVAFPASVTSKQHEITWRKWGSYNFQLLSKKCPPKEFCKVIKCTICLEILLNPHCHKFAFITFLTTLILLITIPCCLIRHKEVLRQCVRCFWHSAFMRITRRICTIILLYIGAGLDAIGWSICWIRKKRAEGKRKRATKRLEAGIELNSFDNRERPRKLSKKRKPLLRKSASIDSLYRQENQRVKWNLRESPSRSSSWGSVHLISGLTIIMCIVTIGNCCDKFVPITHNERSCTNGICKVSTTNELFLSPMQKSICLVASNKEEIVAKITIDILYSIRVCKKGPVTYTYNATINLVSSKKCHSEGVCTSDMCRNTRPDFRIPGIGADNDLPGKSYCTSSCGGWFCGCLSFEEGCLYYRTTARKNNDHRFELYECMDWSNELAFSITVETGTFPKIKRSVHKYLMREGETDHILNHRNKSIGNLTLYSVEEPSGYDTGQYKFIQSGTKIGLRDWGRPNVPLNCDEKGECEYVDTCRCTIATFFNCKCSNHNLFEAINNGLPLIREHHQLLILDGTIPALKFWQTKSHIQITFETTYEIATEVTSLPCDITDYSQLSGCYNCDQSSEFKIVCKSKNTSAAMISCDNKQYFDRINCNSTGYENSIFRAYNRSVVHELCVVKCGGKTKMLEIDESTLNYSHSLSPTTEQIMHSSKHTHAHTRQDEAPPAKVARNTTSEMAQLAKQSAIHRMTDQLTKQMERQLKEEDKRQICFFCKEQHHATKCVAKIDLKTKWSSMIKKKRCVLCTGPNHEASRCHAWRTMPDLQKCRGKICNQMGLIHHTGLCPIKEEMDSFGQVKEFYLQSTGKSTQRRDEPQRATEQPQMEAEVPPRAVEEIYIDQEGRLLGELF